MITGPSSPMKHGPYHHASSTFYDLGSCPRQNLQGVSAHQYNERRTLVFCSRNITYVNFRDGRNKRFENVKGGPEAASVPGGTRQQESGAELYSEDVDVMVHNSLVLLDKERLDHYCHLSNDPIPGGIEESRCVCG